jgi:hypothetical protein
MPSVRLSSKFMSAFKSICLASSVDYSAEHLTLPSVSKWLRMTFNGLVFDLDRRVFFGGLADHVGNGKSGRHCCSS